MYFKELLSKFKELMSQFPAIVQLANLIHSKEFSDKSDRTVAYYKFKVNDAWWCRKLYPGYNCCSADN